MVNRNHRHLTLNPNDDNLRTEMVASRAACLNLCAHKKREFCRLNWEAMLTTMADKDSKQFWQLVNSVTLYSPSFN